MNSMELERELGREILTHLRGLGKNVQVNLNDPQTTCWVEVIPGAALLYADRVEGAGGLPSARAPRPGGVPSLGLASTVDGHDGLSRGGPPTSFPLLYTPQPSRHPPYPS